MKLLAHILFLMFFNYWIKSLEYLLLLQQAESHFSLWTLFFAFSLMNLWSFHFKSLIFSSKSCRQLLLRAHTIKEMQFFRINRSGFANIILFTGFWLLSIFRVKSFETSLWESHFNGILKRCRDVFELKWEISDPILYWK